MLLLFILLLHVIRLSMTRQNLLMDTWKRLWKSAVEIASLAREDLNMSRADRRRENFSSGKNYLLPGIYLGLYGAAELKPVKLRKVLLN